MHCLHPFCSWIFGSRCIRVMDFWVPKNTLRYLKKCVIFQIYLVRFVSFCNAAGYAHVLNIALFGPKDWCKEIYLKIHLIGYFFIFMILFPLVVMVYFCISGKFLVVCQTIYIKKSNCWVMRELGRHFRSYCSEHHSDWSTYVPYIELMMNHIVNEDTGFIPSELFLQQSRGNIFLLEISQLEQRLIQKNGES